MGECLFPEKKSKLELEELIKGNGGKIFQKHDAAPVMICIGERSSHRPQSNEKLND